MRNRDSLTVRELADALGVKVATVRLWRAEGADGFTCHTGWQSPKLLLCDLDRVRRWAYQNGKLGSPSPEARARWRKGLLLSGEAADELGVTSRTIRNWRRAGAPGFKDQGGEHFVTDIEALRAWAVSTGRKVKA